MRVRAVADETLVVREAVRVARLAVATPAVLAAHRGVGAEALPWLALSPFEGARIELQGAGGPLAFAVRPRLVTDDVLALRRAVEAGLGVAILPRWLVADALASGDLADAVPGARAATLPVSIARATGVGRPRRVEAVAAALEAALAKVAA